MDYIWAALGVVLVVAVLRPLLWWVMLSTSLWIGRNTLSEKWGKRVFGRFWDGEKPDYW